ncbi:MAG: hypothetical protein HY562_12205 [Ignavibacteriales bacterium]|nr:hypothetical protein [Ignavibacteriales bacterium]
MNYDKDIKDLYQQLRRDDERHAPSFAFVLSRMRQGATVIRRIPIVARFAGAAAGIALTSFTIVSVRPSAADVEFAQALEASRPIAQWRAPTDMLLKSPAAKLLQNVPKLGETFADMNIKFE